VEVAQNVLPRAVAAEIRLGGHRDEVGVAQDGEVLRHGRRGDVESRCDLARGELAVPDQRQDLAPDRRGERGEHPLHVGHAPRGYPGLAR
jgi:hypothetical protein